MSVRNYRYMYLCRFVYLDWCHKSIIENGWAFILTVSLCRELGRPAHFGQRRIGCGRLHSTPIFRLIIKWFKLLFKRYIILYGYLFILHICMYIHINEFMYFSPLWTATVYKQGNIFFNIHVHTHFYTKQVWNIQASEFHSNNSTMFYTEPPNFN